MSNTYQIYLISDSTGETLDRIFLALKAQFKNIEYKVHSYSFTRTENQILKILEEAKVDEGKKPPEISSDEEGKIRTLVEAYTLEGDLRREVSQNIKRLRDIKSYRGTRHAKGLPSRGQRTKTNSRTRRGNTRKTMGTGKRADSKK